MILLWLWVQAASLIVSAAEADVLSSAWVMLRLSLGVPIVLSPSFTKLSMAAFECAVLQRVQSISFKSQCPSLTGGTWQLQVPLISHDDDLHTHVGSRHH